MIDSIHGFSTPVMTPVYIVENIRGKLIIHTLEIKNETDVAIVLKQRTPFPDGSTRLILPRNQDLPDTPEKAIKQFCEGRNLCIANLKEDLRCMEYDLEQAKKIIANNTIQDHVKKEDTL